MSLPRSSYSQYVDLGGDRATFVVVVPDFTPAVTPTDFVMLSNPAASGRVFRTVAVRMTADSTAVGGYKFYCYKRTAANTGGTTADVAAASMDSHNPAPLGVVSTYSVNPTGLGTGVLIRGENYALPAITTTGYPFSPIIWFGEAQNSQPLTLRAGESLCVSGGGNAYPAGTEIFITFIWSECSV